MSTNYYVNNRKCKLCGRSDEPLHIGKSSAGWAFALRVYPEKNINGLAEWVVYLSERSIVDEYGSAIKLSELIKVIMVRAAPLLRAPVDDYCLSNSAETYDLIIGEFC